MRFAKFSLFLTACWLSAASWAEERIVSIGGDVTEIIYALGGQQQLVGRDSTSIAPAAAKLLPDVGYMRQLSAEGILALKPTKVIASKVAQPASVFEQLKSVGVKVESVPFAYTPESFIEKIQLIGKLIDKPKQAVELAQKFTNELQAIPRTPLKARILFILNHAGANQMVAGRDTVADTGIRLIGATNAAGSGVRFSPISQEGVIAAQPDLIVLTESGVESLGGADKVWQLPGMAHTPAAQAKRVVIVDDLGFLAFSLTTPHELLKIRRVAEQIQP